MSDRVASLDLEFRWRVYIWLIGADPVTTRLRADALMARFDVSKETLKEWSKKHGMRPAMATQQAVIDWMNEQQARFEKIV